MTQQDHENSAAGSKGRRRLLIALTVLLAVGGYLACSWWTLETREVPKESSEKAPVFTLLNQDSRPVSLTNALTRGPVMVVFYRGHW